MSGIQRSIGLQMKSILLFVLLPPCIISTTVTVEDDVDWVGDDDFEIVDGNKTDTDSETTPSPTCQSIVEDVGWAISNYTLCSVRNARPIHLCERCVGEYLLVRKAHDRFEATIDEQGNICGDYFVNLDRLEIVSEAYNFVIRCMAIGKIHWVIAKLQLRSTVDRLKPITCYKFLACFNRVNGSITSTPTDQTLKFDRNYKHTKRCFKRAGNETCTECLDTYNNLTQVYVDIEDSCGEAVCMDIVDTMNITRFIWSDRGCVKRQGVPVSLKIFLGFVTLLPVTFYLLAYFLANKQEAPILQQKRLAEIFALNSNSGTENEGPSTLQRTGYLNLAAFRRQRRSSGGDSGK